MSYASSGYNVLLLLLLNGPKKGRSHPVPTVVTVFVYNMLILRAMLGSNYILYTDPLSTIVCTLLLYR